MNTFFKNKTSCASATQAIANKFPANQHFNSNLCPRPISSLIYLISCTQSQNTHANRGYIFYLTKKQFERLIDRSVIFFPTVHPVPFKLPSRRRRTGAKSTRPAAKKADRINYSESHETCSSLIGVFFFLVPRSRRARRSIFFLRLARRALTLP